MIHLDICMNSQLIKLNTVNVYINVVILITIFTNLIDIVSTGSFYEPVVLDHHLNTN